jgi:hypothetical protein
MTDTAKLLVSTTSMLGAGLSCAAAEWLQPSRPDDRQVWGISGGIRFGLHPANVIDGRPHPEGPRGSIRIGYWRKLKGTVSDGVQVRVNARSEYWASHQPIPGGVSYENFELIEPFRDGQTSIFGLTRAAPGDVLKGR